MVQLVSHPVAQPDSRLREVQVRADRRSLAKRLWRAVADDGTELGFQLGAPLEDGDVVWQSSSVRYVIRQSPEPVLDIPFAGQAEPPAALGWAVGNLHFPVEVKSDRLSAPDDDALRQSLGRAGIVFREASAVFRPHRFASAAAPHRHDRPQAHDHAHHHDHPHGHDHGHPHHHGHDAGHSH